MNHMSLGGLGRARIPAAGGGGGPTELGNDTFLQSTGSAQALEVYNSNWSIVSGTFTVPSGAGDTRTSASATDCVARRSDLTPNAAQYSEITTATGWVASGRYIGPSVRVTSGGNSYSLEANGSEWLLYRVVANAWTQIGTAAWTAANGDVIRLEVTDPNGSTVRVVLKRNGSTVTTVDDTNAARLTAAGSLGICGYDNAASDPSIAYWSGGNL